MMFESQYVDITPDMMLKYYNSNTDTTIDTNTIYTSRLSKIFHIDIDTYYYILFCVFMLPMIIFFISIISSLTMI
jgi:hypothetical protein